MWVTVKSQCQIEAEVEAATREFLDGDLFQSLTKADYVEALMVVLSMVEVDLQAGKECL